MKKASSLLHVYKLLSHVKKCIFQFTSLRARKIISGNRLFHCTVGITALLLVRVFHRVSNVGMLRTKRSASRVSIQSSHLFIHSIYPSNNTIASCHSCLAEMS